MVQLLDSNDVSVSSPCYPFARQQQMFYATAAEKKRDADVMAEVRLQFPYPPKSCSDAITTLQNLDTSIKTFNEKIASGTSDRVAKRYLDSHLSVQNDFKTWLNAKQCLSIAQQQEDAAFSQQLQDALNEEQTTQTGKKGIDNLVIFGSLALLVVGAIIIILKKSKPKSSSPK